MNKNHTNNDNDYDNYWIDYCQQMDKIEFKSQYSYRGDSSGIVHLCGLPSYLQRVAL